MRRERWRWVIGLAFLWTLVRVLSGFDGLYGQDAHEYLRYARALKAWIVTGADPGFSYWPPGYPLAVALLALTGIPIAVCSQLVSGLSWLAAFFFGTRALERLHTGRYAPAYWGLFFSLSPYLMRVALSSMSDMLAIALLCVFVERALTYRDTDSDSALMGSAAALGFACVTRFSSPIVALPLALWLTAIAIRTGKLRALIMMIAGFAPSVLLARRLMSPSELALSNADEWNWANFFARSFETASGGAQTFAMPNIAAAIVALIHPGFCFLGVFLLAKTARQDFAQGACRAIAASWLTLSLFLCGLALQNHRHHLASLPMLMWLLFPAFGRWLASIRPLSSRSVRAAAAASLAAVQLGLLSISGQTLLRGQKQEVAMAARLQTMAPVRLFTFGFTLGLRNRGVPQEVVELWNENPPPAKPGDLVLFARERLSVQWKSHRLIANFETLRPRLAVEPIADFGGGWLLYEIAR